MIETEQIGQHRINIQGTPIAQKRPKFARRGNFVKTYNPQETKAGKFWLEAKSQWRHPPISHALYVRMIFFMKRPKSHFGTGKNKVVLKKTAPFLHTSKPDIDNLEKMVYDCLNQLVWQDDALIAQSSAIKVYSDNPHTEIIITEIEAQWEEEIKKSLMML